MGRATQSQSVMLRTALLVLLSERESHGYDLAPRLAELGISPDKGALYRTLRSMDRLGEVRSEWGVSSRGPARRVYSLTEDGRRLLVSAVEGMERHRVTISGLLHRCRHQTGVAATTTTEEG